MWIRSQAAVVRKSIFFFFSSRRRHTRLQGDWSSDVCSSDLSSALGLQDRDYIPYQCTEFGLVNLELLPPHPGQVQKFVDQLAHSPRSLLDALDRKSVV